MKRKYVAFPVILSLLQFERGQTLGSRPSIMTAEFHCRRSGLSPAFHLAKTSDDVEAGDDLEETLSGDELSVEATNLPDPLGNRELTPDEMMRALNTSPRRIVLSLLASTSIALFANFLGMTSKILETLPESTVEASGIDALYPRGDYKRFHGDGYTFLFPKYWVADTALELAKASRRAANLDYQMAKRRSPDYSGVIPDAAFGPPGRLERGVSQGDTNVSVVLSTLLPGFSLQGTLGSPEAAAETLLRISLAPEGSGRTATLVSAFEDMERQLYQFEYTLDRGQRGPPLRAISIIAKQSEDTLLTLTVVASLDEWNGTNNHKLRKIASSFHLA